MVAFSEPAAELLDLGKEELEREDSAQFFAGNKLFPGAEPHAHCYAGHQFGTFAGNANDCQLGDGAAMYLGEVLNSKGESWEVQFKGSGPTPYSRRADGRKVLRSSIREFLCSEAMHHLGIPTTRALSLVTSDSRIRRDPLYNGNVIAERCSIVTRLAPTYLRFGSFEIFKGEDSLTGRTGPSPGNVQLLKQMLQYTIQTFFSEVASAHPDCASEAAALAFYRSVIAKTAELVACWQAAGFVHGVLNTDNMSILGLTIDYGPYGFMDYFDPNFVPNGSDSSGRYRYSTQPEICEWNLRKFSEVLSPVLSPEAASEALKVYKDLYEEAYLSKMRAKLGLETQDPADKALIADLFRVMEATAADFSGTFRLLAAFTGGNAEEAAAELAGICASPEVLAKATRRAINIGRPSIPAEQLQTLYQMAQSDPQALAARWGAPPAAIMQELDDEMAKLESIVGLAKKAEKLEGMTVAAKSAQDEDAWITWLKVYGARLASETRSNELRRAAMDAVNPSFILRNWVAQEVIAKAEGGDYRAVQELLGKLEKPYGTVGMLML
ncbi:unnamed protein product [Chrysoparadoxa australica]